MQALIELLTNFGVTWDRLIGQIVTFTLLIVLLRLVMYKPILNMLEQRKQKIAQAMKDAELAHTAKLESEAEATNRLKQATKKAETLLDEAKKAAEVLKKDVLAQTQVELQRVKQEQAKDLERARDKMVAEVRKDMVRLVVATTTKVLEAELTKDQHQAMTKRAIKELE